MEHLNATFRRCHIKIGVHREILANLDVQRIDSDRKIRQRQREYHSSKTRLQRLICWDDVETASHDAVSAREVVSD